ncbi:hypothetical protein [Thalassobellus sediminis]|uniref:hypothetical protein n=1 Tax=Thalassobellus sediminis TaxID=3367753 RepID=UPI0037AF083F
MKPQNNVFKTFILLLAIVSAISCSKDEPTKNPNNENDKLVKEDDILTTDDLDTYAGDLGLSFSAREIAKKGHQATNANITVNTDVGDFSQTIPIDPDTNLAQLSLTPEDLKDLTEADKDKLKDGVPIDVSILDENDNILASKSFSILSFRSNPEAQELDNNTLSDIRNNLTFKEDIPYYIQLVKENQNESKLVAYVNYSSGGTFGVPVNLRDNYDFDDNNPSKNLHQFTFKRIPNDPEYFAIISGVTSGSKHLFLRIRDAYLFQDQSRFVEDTDLNALPVDHRFKFVRDNNTNYYKISPKAKGIIRKKVFDGKTRLIATSNQDYEVAYFRILTPKIDWDIQEIEAIYTSPILPPAGNADSFQSNAKLTNCTNGPLKESFEILIDESKTSNVSFEESFSMTSTETIGGSLTIKAETKASFFGQGVTVSGEATASYESQSSITSVNTQFTGQSETKQQTVTRTREISVPPGNAVLVYDTFQKYSKIEMPYIQKYRIKGTYINSSEELTGDEIFTQFLFTNANGGVVTRIGSDFIHLTVRGKTTIENAIHTTSEAESVEPNCN